MSFGGLGSVEDDMFEHLMEVLATDEFELKEYVDEESKPLVVLNVSKCDNGWCLFLANSDLSNLVFACR
jgi:hypothetical protein